MRNVDGALANMKGASAAAGKAGAKAGVKVRLDKWLWAARFYKTRAIARQAIEGGKVRCEGFRAKPGKTVEPGLRIRLQQGDCEREVIVEGVRNDRRPAPEAQRLYRETEASIRRREEQAASRKTQPAHWPPATRPSKKQRRDLRKFKQEEG